MRERKIVKDGKAEGGATNEDKEEEKRRDKSRKKWRGERSRIDEDSGGKKAVKE